MSNWNFNVNLQSSSTIPKVKLSVNILFSGEQLNRSNKSGIEKSTKNKVINKILYIVAGQWGWVCSNCTLEQWQLITCLTHKWTSLQHVSYPLIPEFCYPTKVVKIVTGVSWPGPNWYTCTSGNKNRQKFTLLHDVHNYIMSKTDSSRRSHFDF